MGKILGFKQILKNKMQCLEEGFSKHHDIFYSTKFKENVEYECDYFIQFNIFNSYYNYKRDSKSIAYKYIINSTKPYLVCEEGAFRQYPSYKRFGWFNYKNGLGNFVNDNVDNSRWLKFQNDTGIVIKDWKSPGDNILIMGQVEKDTALIELYDSGYTSFNNYVIDQIEIIRKYTDRPIVFRPHPKQMISPEYQESLKIFDREKNVSISNNYTTYINFNGGEGLTEDFKNTYCVVTFNSNSSVEAVTSGIPVFNLSSTASTYDISHHNFSEIENLNYDIDITDWCNKIAYTIWNEDEIASGMMWEHFKSCYEKSK